LQLWQQAENIGRNAETFSRIKPFGPFSLKLFLSIEIDRSRARTGSRWTAARMRNARLELSMPNDASRATTTRASHPTRREVVASGAALPLALTLPSDTAPAQTAENGVSSGVKTNITVNGRPHALTLDPRSTLLDVLREQLDLTGSKKGCDQGQCGACTVLINGRRVVSCLTLAVMQDGASITTIEGLATDGKLHPLHQAFIDHDAFQCGYCTPGQICSAAGLITEGKAKTPDQIRELMSGNICRCGAYPNIVAAIQQVMGQS
jgi:xanthine dehydrogenase YagT iron-sulfur-binding subunit